MKETLAYIRAKERQGEPSLLLEMKIKFKDKDIEQILKELKRQGMIFEPRDGIFRSLD